MAAGQKRQFRIPITAGNSEPPARRRFLDLDFICAVPEGAQAVPTTRGLNCRVRHERPPKTLLLRPLVNIGDVVFPGGRGDELADAADSLLVTEVYPHRLREIAEAEARLEGVAAGWGLKLATRRAASPPEVFGALAAEVGSRRLRQWHDVVGSTEATHRNLFDLDYLRKIKGGFTTWRLNPWVWAVSFDYYPVRPCDLLMRLASGTLERKRA